MKRDIESPVKLMLTGGEAVARMFKAYGVGPIFGMGGFQLLPFYDACRRLGLKPVSYTHLTLPTNREV